MSTDQVTSYDDNSNRWRYVSSCSACQPLQMLMRAHARFSAEAVQVGNVGSAMGIAGVWTVAVHEEGTFCQASLNATVVLTYLRFPSR